MWNSFYHLEAVPGDFEVSTRIVARPDSVGQAAMLLAEWDSTRMGPPNAGVLYGHDSLGGKLVWGSINQTNQAWAAYSDSVVYLRLRKHGDTAFAEYSSNGTSWLTLTSGSPFGNHWFSGINASNLEEMGDAPDACHGRELRLVPSHLPDRRGIGRGTRASPGDEGISGFAKSLPVFRQGSGTRGGVVRPLRRFRPPGGDVPRRPDRRRLNSWGLFHEGNGKLRRGAGADREGKIRDFL